MYVCASLHQAALFACKACPAGTYVMMLTEACMYPDMQDTYTVPWLCSGLARSACMWKGPPGPEASKPAHQGLAGSAQAALLSA